MEGRAKKRRIYENEGIAGGASSTHTSTEGHEIATSSGYDYEVFLSFRGPDTRAGFTDFLYTSMIDMGIRAYKDDEDLRKGEEFGPTLLQAIEQSRISIPILSKGYASSVWCLKELVKMVECRKTKGQKIVPIFYDVAPEEVRYQIKGYKEAFDSHKNKNRHDEGTMHEWKAALEEVSSLDGWNLLNMHNRREGELARECTQEVFNELKRAYLEISEHLVSVDSHMDAIMEMIGARTSETRIIGIHGMGGIGKTTIAKLIYNNLLPNFENYCFLRDIRETSKGNGIQCLQNQLISDILKTKRTYIKDIDEGTQTIKDRLSNKRVLLTLDDVEEDNHIDAIVGKHDWLGRGSKIIITTRNKYILDVLKVDHSYELHHMDLHQSLQLFSKHAFRRDSPLDEYIDQSNRAVGIAGGLPLALELIGSLLCHTKREMWHATLKRLESVPHDKVQSKLKVSYDALDDRHKHIFLDIACLFIGYDKDIMVHFWDASRLFPEVAIEVLQNMSLIKIIEDNKVWMHDQLRDLGREIVRQESKMEIKKQSRVWDPKEALDLLRIDEKKKKLEALRLPLDHQHNFTCKDFERLPNLRFLEVYGSKETFRAEERLFWHKSPSNVCQENLDLLPQLQWLSWHDIPPTFEITNFSMEDVVILDLSRSEITHDWKGWSHMEVMKSLKILNLSYCRHLERTPNFLAHSNLERLILSHCESLIEIDKSIGWLKRLVSLDASYCQHLQRLPEVLDGDLARLEYLSLNYCKSLERLPDSIGNLKSLIELHISGIRIRELSDSIRNLKKLKVVKMLSSNISKIPEALWTIEKLEEIECHHTMGHQMHVKVGDCIYRNKSLRILKLVEVEINTLPMLPQSLIELKLSCLDMDMDMFPDLSNLTNLKSLDLWFDPPSYKGISNGLVEVSIPRWVGNLSNLESLDLASFDVTTSPIDLTFPPRLKSLHLECPNLCCLPRLPSSLSFLELRHSQSLYLMENLPNLKKLAHLRIHKAAITEIKSLGCLENLRDLWLYELGQVKILSDLTNLNKLRSLRVICCDNLVEIQEELPKSLQDLEIGSCGSLQKLPDLSSLNRLREVGIYRCKKLNVEAISRLCSEKSIYFNYGNFTRLLDPSCLEVGRSMDYCSEKEWLFWHKSPSNVCQENLDLPPQLQWLSWHDVLSTFENTNFSKENVVILDLSRNEITHDWKGWKQMEAMKSLKILNLSYCRRLERTPNFFAHSNLERLILSHCESLIEIDRSIGWLKRLVSLDASYCRHLQRLPEVLDGDLARLEYLSLNYCESLERLPYSIGNLQSLIELHISGSRIRELPNSIKNLKELKVVKMRHSVISKIPEALWTIEKLEKIECGGQIGHRIHVKIGNCIYRNQSLRILKLMNAEINALPMLPKSLVKLKLSCLDMDMDMFPDLSYLTNLKVLDLQFGPPSYDGISNGPVEVSMPRWIGNLSNMEYLDLGSPYVTTSPTDLTLPPCLKSLHLKCPNLRCLPRLPSSLSSLDMQQCNSLCLMEDPLNLKKLSYLDINHTTITEIQGLGCLENLQGLRFFGLGQVKILYDLTNLNKLRRLQVGRCYNLIEIQGKLPKSLEELYIYECESLLKLPDLSSSNGLREVRIHRCEKLNVEAISRLCLEKSIMFWQNESEGEDDG